MGIMDKINYERARRGKQPFVCDSNLDSWYGHSKGKDCCYTSDHANAECMWDKPSEILGGSYPTGFEISHWRSPSASPTSAVDGWMNSGGHSAVALSTNGWDLHKIGCWYTGKFANCWFFK